MSEQQAATPYDLKLAGDGITLERKVTAEVARGILNLVLGGVPTFLGQPEPAGPKEDRAADGKAGPRARRDRISLREWLDNCQPKSNPDKITAIGAYLADHEGVSDFARDDIKARFRTAGEAAPGNYPRDFMVAVRTGWIAEDSGSAGRFYVTQKGRVALTSKFASDAKKVAAKVRPARKSRHRGESGESENAIS